MAYRGLKATSVPRHANLWAATQGESSRHWKTLTPALTLTPASPLRHVPSVHVGNVPSDTEMPKGLSKRADPPTPPPPSVNTPCCCFHAHLLAVGCLTGASLRHPPLCFHPHVVGGPAQYVLSAPTARVLVVCPRACGTHADWHVRVRRGPPSGTPRLLVIFCRIRSTSRAKKKKKMSFSPL